MAMRASCLKYLSCCGRRHPKLGRVRNTQDEVTTITGRLAGRALSHTIPDLKHNTKRDMGKLIKVVQEFVLKSKVWQICTNHFSASFVTPRSTIWNQRHSTADDLFVSFLHWFITRHDYVNIHVYIYLFGPPKLRVLCKVSSPHRWRQDAGSWKVLACAVSLVCH